MDSIKNIATALAEAQAELKNPSFDSTNPHFKNKFASLAAVRAAVVPVFAKHGLTIIQPLVSNEEGVGVATTILHKSGERLDFAPFFLPAAKRDPQGFGSAATYARRYALMAIAGVVGDEDDDAEAAQEAHATEPPPAKWKNPTERKHYSTEIQRFWGAGDSLGVRQLWDELDNAKRGDIWRDLNTKQQNEIKEMLAQTAPKGKAA